jgi:predicted DNA-binding transcriptional regulator AlpA
MQNVVFTQLSTPELQQLFRGELEKFFAEQSLKPTTEADEIGGVELAMKITGKAKPTIYSLCSERKIPHSKRGKQLYFSKRELLEWIHSGKRKTATEIKSAAQSF